MADRQFLVPGHGYKNADDTGDEYLTPGQMYFNEEAAPVVASGHTHTPSMDIAPLMRIGISLPFIFLVMIW